VAFVFFVFLFGRGGGGVPSALFYPEKSGVILSTSFSWVNLLFLSC